MIYYKYGNKLALFVVVDHCVLLLLLVIAIKEPGLKIVKKTFDVR